MPAAASACVYAKDLQRLANFYAEVAHLVQVNAQADHAVLESAVQQLVVVAIPPALAAAIVIATPPERREDTPIKLALGVASLAQARAAAARRGGVLDPAEREWTFDGCSVCDGHDPEGNVFQLRQAQGGEIELDADYAISTDKARLDLHAMHAFLSRSYWSPGIPLATVVRGAAHSLCFGLFYRGSGAQVGFCRVISDRASYAYLADVYVLEAHRGRGLAKRLLEAVLAHPELQGLRKFMLATLDAHGLYRPFGFAPLARPERMMEIVKPNVYQRQGGAG